MRTCRFPLLIIFALSLPSLPAAGQSDDHPVGSPVGSWRVASRLGDDRYEAAATLLRDGRVLISGGYSLSTKKYLRTAEVWDPRTLKSRNVGSMSRPRASHSATLLADGRVLIAGGATTQGDNEITAEIWNPNTGRFTRTGAMRQGRRLHHAVRLADGRVVIAGGGEGAQDVELWDPRSGIWSSIPAARECSQSSLAALPEGGFMEAAWCGAGREVITVRKWSGAAGRLEEVSQLRFSGYRDFALAGPTQALVFLHDGQMVAVRLDSGEKIPIPRGLLPPRYSAFCGCVFPAGEAICFDHTQMASLDIGGAKATWSGYCATPGRPLVPLTDGRLLAVSRRKVLLWAPSSADAPPRE